MTPEAIGQLIRKQRKSLGLNQREASGLCGVGVTFLSRVERGQPTAEIGKVLHVIQSLGLKLHISGTET